MATPGAIGPIERVARFWRDLSAPTLFVASFAALVVVGTLGLWLLPGLQAGPPLGFLDALFTMTSAVCVTGLAVVDTATQFTFWGQLWILVFVQLGGLGVVTLTSLIIGLLGRQLSIRSEMMTGAPAELLGRQDLRQLLLAVARFTLIVEALGAVGLWIAFAPSLGAREAIWPAIFHAVMAFCNAGLSTFSDSYLGWSEAPLVLLVTSALIVIGSLGFLSSSELVRWWKKGGLRGPIRLSSHTWAATVATGLLLVIGTVSFLAFEWRGAFADFGPVDTVVNAFFLSASGRTAGFHAVPIAGLGNESLSLLVLLMVIGGSPGSTAGGIKTTAAAVLVALAIQRARGRRHAVLHGRTVPAGTVERTVSLVLLAFVVLTGAVFLLNVTETGGRELAEARSAFLPILFEAVSAFATTGLTMDTTPQLSALGRLAVVGLMFMGRIGPLSFFAAISIKSRSSLRGVRPAQEDVIIG